MMFIIDIWNLILQYLRFRNLIKLLITSKKFRFLIEDDKIYYNFNFAGGLIPKAVFQFKNIKKISLNFTFDDSDMQQLVKYNSNIEIIDLYCTKISDYGLKLLSETNHKITIIDLSYCKISDDALKLLIKNNKNIYRIDLFSTNITDRGLTKLKNIKYIDLRKTNMTKKIETI